MVDSVYKEVKYITGPEFFIYFHNLILSFKNKVMLGIKVPLEPDIFG